MTWYRRGNASNAIGVKAKGVKAIGVTVAVVAFVFSLPALAQPAKGEKPKVPASAVSEKDEPQVEWDFSARFRPRLEFRLKNDFGLQPTQLNYNKPDATDIFSTQSRLGADLTWGRQLSAKLLFQHAAIWGTTGGDALTDPSLFVHQGWIRYQPFDLWYLKVGRQELAYGDHRVLGTVGWSQVGRAWDAAKTGIVPIEDVFVDFFAGKYQEGLTDTDFANDDSVFDGDGYLLGIYAGLGGLVKPALTDVDLYLLNDLQVDNLDDDAPNRRSITLLGTRLSGAWSLIDATAEGGYQLGSACVPDMTTQRCTDDTVDRSAFFVDTELGGSIDFGAKARFFAGFGIASGDDPDTEENEAYFHFYPTAHKWLGYTDIIGPRSNVQEFRLGATVTFAGIKIGETFHHFTRLQPESETAGMEFDTTAFFTLLDPLKLGVGHGLFIPGDGATIGDVDPEDPAHWMFVQLDAKL